MADAVTARPSRHRLLGDLHTMELHDLTNEKPRCRVDSLVDGGYAVTFCPDVPCQAYFEGFTDCRYCIGRDEDMLL